MMNPSLLIRDGSPWDLYEKVFTCDLAGDTAIVVSRRAPSEILTLRSYTGDTGVKMLLCFSHLQHENVLPAREYYCQEGSMYALCEDLPITLEDVVTCDAFPSEAQLAAILGQVLDGVLYLMAKGLEHRSLDCSSILMGLDGTVKIARLEDTHVRGNSQRQTLEAR
uniref:Serine/threonine-protein kinase ste20 n=1 Tax=Talaromyces marneffei PM1 TaxID=1077442 RepID=A0A093X7M4_TALMA